MNQAFQEAYPDTEASRTRRKVLIAVAVTAAITAVAVVVGIVLLAGSGSSKTAAVSSSSAVAPDAAAQHMCEKLLAARLLDAKGDHSPAAGGYGGSVHDMEASTARIEAQTFAMQSQVAELQAIGVAGSDPVKAATVRKLEAWCKAHDLG